MCYVYMLFLIISCVAEGIIVYPIICDSLCASHLTRQPLCTVKSVDKEPSPKDGAITAQAPSQHSEGWYIYADDDGSQALALNISWSQNRLYFLTDVTGYVITITRASLLFPYFREFSFHQSVINNSDVLHAAEVIINYPCFGRWGEVVEPGFDYVVSIKSLPLYHPYKNIQVQEVIIKVAVPGCDNKNVSQVKQCKVERSPDETDDNENDDYYESSSYDDEYNSKDYKDNTRRLIKSSVAFPSITVAVTVLVVAILVIFALIYVLKLRRKKHRTPHQEYSEPNEDPKLLILINSKDEDGSYLDAANVLATMLGTTQTFNLWQLSRIGEQEKWAAEELQRCSHVVFICTPKGKLHYDEFNSRNDGFVDAFIAGMHRHTDVTVKKLEATAVYFNTNACTCIPENLSGQVQRFQVPEQFDQFTERIRKKICHPQFSAQFEELQAFVETIRNDGLKSSVTTTEHIDENSRWCASATLLGQSRPLINYNHTCASDNNNAYDSGIASAPQSYKTSTL